MKETRTINLNGLVYHIDYDAHHILHDYLQDIELRLPQDDRQEVMNDIEARIAELFQKALFAKNAQVVNLEMVNSVKSQIGDPSYIHYIFNINICSCAFGNDIFVLFQNLICSGTYASKTYYAHL